MVDIKPTLLAVMAATACASAVPIEDAQVGRIPHFGHSTQPHHNVHSSHNEFKGRPKSRLRRADGIRRHHGARDENPIQEHKKGHKHTQEEGLSDEHDNTNIKRAAANRGVFDSNAADFKKLKVKAVTRHKREVKSVVRREQDAIKRALLKITRDTHAAETLEHDLKSKPLEKDDEKLASRGNAKSFSNTTDKKGKTSGGPAAASMSLTLSVVLGIVAAAFLH